MKNVTKLPQLPTEKDKIQQYSPQAEFSLLSALRKLGILRRSQHSPAEYRHSSTSIPGSLNIRLFPDGIPTPQYSLKSFPRKVESSFPVDSGSLSPVDSGSLSPAKYERLSPTLFRGYFPSGLITGLSSAFYHGKTVLGEVSSYPRRSSSSSPT